LHPNASGRERELRALADAVRRVIRATVTHQGGAEETAEIAARVEAIAETLESRVPVRQPDRYMSGFRVEDPEPHDVFPFDAVLGLYNPVALPIEMKWVPPKAIGHAHFDDPYEGPPGCVHGAILAGAFDQVFNVANISSGTAGPTAKLTLEYRRPTPLHADLVFEAWVDKVEGRKVTTVGHVLHDGQITVKSHGLFIMVDPDRIQALVD
jgi:acyl-coenzyme A thioesterase PaaI-like protein